MVFFKEHHHSFYLFPVFPLNHMYLTGINKLIHSPPALSRLYPSDEWKKLNVVHRVSWIGGLSSSKSQCQLCFSIPVRIAALRKRITIIVCGICLGWGLGQKLKRTSKELRTLPSELARLPSRAVASSTSMNVGLAPFSVIRYESNTWSSCRKNSGFSQASPTSTLKAGAQFLGFPSSQWIDAPSSADSVSPVFVAKALFHYTLCNVHSC